MNIHDFHHKKTRKEKISIVTCYDYPTARLLAKTSLDCVLVGDSVATVIHGFPHTLSATLDMMVLHTEAVNRGIGQQFIVSDLPFLSYRKSLSKSVSAAERLMRAGAHAVKLEGGRGNLNLIKHFVESGIPVMGHIGLTPQFIHMLGGYKMQGKNKETQYRLKEEAEMLEEAGCFAIVLECIPRTLAKDITTLLSIPTIGIGAGPDTDGQVLVLHDVLGLHENFQAKFVKSFIKGHTHFTHGIQEYVNAIHQGDFPAYEHCYHSE